MTLPLRVGSVPYLVARPLDAGLEGEPGIELTHDVPSRLVERLRAGELDAALVSSIELFRRPDYRYIDGLAVSGRGFVGSVQLFLRRAVEEVRTVALDPASRAARTLCRILLPEHTGRPVEFHSLESGGDPREAGTDAWLRIGDTALREHLAEGLPHWNPSQAWCRATGLPFVFAPWIVRPGADGAALAQVLGRAAERGTRALEALAQRAAEEWSVPVDACHHYLAREITYHPEEGEMRATLSAFRDRAAALGLCRGDLEPEPLTVAGLRT